MGLFERFKLCERTKQDEQLNHRGPQPEQRVLERRCAR